MRLRHGWWLGFCGWLVAPLATAEEVAPVGPAATLSPFAKAMAAGEEALATWGVAGCERAHTAFSEALQVQPDDAMAQLKAAEALVCILRIRTHGNLVMFDGTNDTPSHRALWQKLAPRATSLARAGLAKRPADIWARGVYAEAYMYSSSSMGIVEAIVKGAADEYLKNADALIAAKPSYDLASGQIYKASFYTVAPWPIADADKSIHFAREAVRLFPKSTRNHYVLGVIAHRQEKWDEAKAAYQNAMKASCSTRSERDVCGWIRKEVQRALTMLAAGAAP